MIVTVVVLPPDVYLPRHLNRSGLLGHVMLVMRKALVGALRAGVLELGEVEAPAVEAAVAEHSIGVTDPIHHVGIVLARHQGDGNRQPE
jgi:hypothetical protein